MAETGLPGARIPAGPLGSARHRGEGDGLARPHVHEPEMLLGAQRGQRGLDVIVLAHRDARGGDEEVGAQPPGEPGLDLVLPVTGHAEIQRLGARRADLRHQRVGVGVRDLAGPDRGAQVRHLVPGGENPHHAAAGSPRPDSGPPSRARRGRRARARGRARGAGHPVACPRRAAARSRRGGAAAARAPRPLHRHVLLRDHRVGALRQRRAGEDAKGLARPQGALGQPAAGTWPARVRRAGRAASAPGCRRCAAHSRPWRSSARAGCPAGHHRLGEHPVQRVEQATRSSPRRVMRERMRSRASSTGITPPFYPGGGPGRRLSDRLGPAVARRKR